MPSKRKRKIIPVKPVKKRVKLPLFLHNVQNPKYLLLVALATVALLFLIQLAAFTPSYQTNDDIGMTFVVSGSGTSPQPDEHMRYSHVFLGKLLKNLYSHFPAFPWYGSYHFFVHFIAMTALLYAILSRDFIWTRFIFFLIFFGAIELYFLNNLQFTITAFIAGMSGIFLFLSAIKLNSSKGWIALIMSAALLMISCIVRSSSFYLVMLLALPILAVTLYENRNARSVIMKFAVYFTLVIVTGTALVGYNKTYYNNDPDWKDFFTINSLKSRFIDWDHTVYNEETRPVFDEANWSRNDYYMLLTWFFADETVYSKESMEKVTSHFPNYKVRLSLKESADKYLGILWKMLPLLLIALLFFQYVSNDNKNKTVIFGTLSMVLTLMLYLIVTKRLPARVYHPMFSFLVVIPLFLTDKRLQMTHSRYGKLKNTLIVFALSTVIFTIFSQFNHGRQNKVRNNEFRKTLVEIAPQDDDLFVVWGASLPYTRMLPFDTMDYFKKFKLISLGTTLRTPITKERMKEYGITDIYQSLYENDNVNFVVGNRRYLYYFSEYVKEHYGIEIQFQYGYQSNVFSVVNIFSENHSEFESDVQELPVINPYR